MKKNTIEYKIAKWFNVITLNQIQEKKELLIKEYEEGLSPSQIKSKYNIPYTDFGTFLKRLGVTRRSFSDANKLSGTFRKKAPPKPKKPQDGTWYRYMKSCKFRNHYDDWHRMPGYELLQHVGFYNPKKNPNGVDRDHMFSIYEGWIRGISWEIISHPANCQFIVHKDNLIKGPKSNITLEELLEKIKEW